MAAICELQLSNLLVQNILLEINLSYSFSQARFSSAFRIFDF